MTNEETAKYHDLKSKLAIDPLRVEDHLIEMPMLVMEAAEYAASASELQDVFDLERKRVRAEVAEIIRVGYGDKPPSETYVNSRIPHDPQYIEAERDYNKASTDAALWKALVDALRAKASSLKHICELITAGYLTPSSVFRSEKRTR